MPSDEAVHLHEMLDMVEGASLLNSNREEVFHARNHSNPLTVEHFHTSLDHERAKSARDEYEHRLSQFDDRVKHVSDSVLEYSRVVPLSSLAAVRLSPTELEDALGQLRQVWAAKYAVWDDVAHRLEELVLAKMALEQINQGRSLRCHALQLEHFPPSETFRLDEVLGAGGGGSVGGAQGSHAHTVTLFRSSRHKCGGGGGAYRLEQERSVRVFISSTFLDMAEERELLLKDTFQQLRAFCQARGVHLTPVDLRWGITAEQSRAGDVVNICFREIEQCRPYFLCMLGQRYGWAQPSSTSTTTSSSGGGDGGAVARQQDDLLRRTLDKAMASSEAYAWLQHYADRSVTELEIRHALLNDPNPTALEHALFYFRDASHRPTRPSSATAGGGDGHEDRGNGDKLCALKREIRSVGCRVHQYHSPGDMAEHALGALKALIDAEFPVGAQPTPLEKERAEHAAFASTRARVYVGRQAYFDAINDHVSSRTHRSSGGGGQGFLAVLGPSGSGKSALVSNWVMQFRRLNPDRMIIAHFIGSTASSTDLGRMLHRICSEIRDGVPGLQERPVPSEVAVLVEQLPQWLGEAGRAPGGLVVVLDALNQMDDAQGEHQLAWLPRTLPPGVHVVVSTLAGRCLDAIEARGWESIVRVTPLGAVERRMLVEDYMEQYGKTLTAHQSTRILEAAQTRNPLFLRTMLEEIRLFGDFHALDARIDHLLGAADPPELFELVFLRVEQDAAASMHGLSHHHHHHHEGSATDLVQRLLCGLWVSRRGLSEHEVLGLLRVPQSVWSRLKLAFGDYLISRSGMLLFFHDYMRQGVQRRYLGGASSAATTTSTTTNNKSVESTYRKMLVKYFMDEWGGGGEDGGAPPTRVMEEVPYQLFHMEAWKQLAEFITDASSFISLFQSDFKFDLYRFWRKCAENIGQREMEAAFERGMRCDGDGRGGQRGDGPHHHGSRCEWLAHGGKFLQEVAAYDAAEKLLRAALSMEEERWGGGALGASGAASRSGACGVADRLDALGYLYRVRGKYHVAAPLYQRSLGIRRGLLGGASASAEDQQQLAQSMNSLAILYRHQGKYEEAEPLYTDALEMRQRVLGPVHQDVAQSLNSLGCLKQDVGDYASAESFFLRAIALREQLLGAFHPDVAMSVCNLAGLYLDQNRYEQARPLYHRGLDIYQGVFGQHHPSVAQTLNSLAALAQEQGAYATAASLYTETLAIKRALLGAHHPELALTLNDFAVMYARQDRYDMAEPLYQEALAIRKKAQGEAHPDYAQSLNNLGSLYQDKGEYHRALPLFQRGLSICEAAFGSDHMDVASSLTNIAGLYQFQGKHYDALPLYHRALGIYERLLGRTHADVAVTYNDLAVLYFNIKDYARAETNYNEALDIYKSVFGEVHPDVAQAMFNLGEFYKVSKNFTQASSCFQRAASIYREVLGEDHPRTKMAAAAARGVAK